MIELFGQLKLVLPMWWRRKHMMRVKKPLMHKSMVGTDLWKIFICASGKKCKHFLSDKFVSSYR
uniref:Uncharacterized protein n=1 Tax=Rhizophora mucronata TaxID=61149 RepID=A0A2P2LEE8_RHIMU